MTHTIEVSGAAFILDRDGAEPYSAMVSCNGFAKEYRGNWAANEATQETSRSPNSQAIPRALRCWIDGLKREHHRCPEMHITPLPWDFDSTPDRFRRNIGAKYLGFDGAEALRA